MSHSKRNTSRPVFTSHERALAKSHWASNSARLNRDSFLPFGSCGLCLEIAREPVSCRRGDIFCRECALANLLAQKKDIKRAEKARQHAEEENARIRALEDEEDRERAIRDFELTQAGLEKSARKAAGATPEDTGASKSAGAKRKFELDEDELERIAKQDRVKARKAIEDEKAAKPTLPSFWTPSLTPDTQGSKLSAAVKKGKAVPTCPASKKDDPHSVSMQNLITIHFNEEAETDKPSQNKRRICPSCLKVLTNASDPIMSKQCGHVLCHSCVKQFMVPAKTQAPSEDSLPMTCYVCDVPVSSKSSRDDVTGSSSIPGMVRLRSEGTGFSARGTSTVEKTSVAFQC